jgi:putative tricarboxylic transport membrane protein
MDWLNMIAGLGKAFVDLSTPYGYWLITIGVAVGILGGALPGVSTTMTVALLAVFTFTMDPLWSIILLSAVQLGGTYGGSISATVLNIPGTPASAPTAIEGYQLTKKGEAEVALGINVFTSFMGNNLGLVMLLLTMPLFVKLSMMFGPWEMFWFGVFGVFIAANLSEGDTLKGLIAATVGLVLACIGIDPIDGSPRFSFDSVYLSAGIPLIPAMIGLFGFTEVFDGLTDLQVSSFPLKKTSLVGAARLWWKYRWLSVRTSVLGYIIGVAPGIGASVSCWVGYDHARTTSKEPEKFGHGSIEGLIGSETCNMANVPGAYAPVLSLGVPGDAPTAIMLGILMLHGIRPGPTFMLTNPEWLYQIVVALFISGILFVLIGTYAGKGLVRLFVSTPRTAMSAIVAVLCALGAYATNIHMVDIYTAFVFGVLGIIMKGLGMPVSPLVLGLILGADLLDVEFRRALLAGKGSIAPFFTRTVSIAMLIFIAMVLFYQYGYPKIKGDRKKKDRTVILK